MLQYLNIHNFRCFQNFEFKPGDNSSLLLIGKNASGKSTLAQALAVFQRLGQGVSRIFSLFTENDFTLRRTNERMSFKIEVLLDGRKLAYSLVLDKPENFRELRVVEESVLSDGEPVFTRSEGQVTIHQATKKTEFSLDWHAAALPLITERPTTTSPVSKLCAWFKNMHILAPTPQLISGESLLIPGSPATALTLSCDNFAAYLTEFLSSYPAAYMTIHEFLKELMPDLVKFENILIASNARQLKVHFGGGGASFDPEFNLLSDGEKCMFLCATILAAQAEHPDLFVFWDEPDSYLALSEIEHFVRTLRQKFHKGSQIWMTSHNELTMNCFSHENTFLLRHKNHCDPVELRPVDELIGSRESISRKMLRNELD